MKIDSQNIVRLKTDQLSFDHRNPRLIEFGVDDKSSEQEILQILWNEMAVDEIVLSIAASGFLPYEPLIVVNENGRNIVIEGNRRLAAVKSILHPEYLDNETSTTYPVSNTIRKDIEELPVLFAKDREAAWRFIGYKHVNGPAKWGSYAKAKYIAEVHNLYGVPLNDIALQIGDKHRTVQRLYRALMVIEQAENIGVFNRSDIKTSRLYFSHLYTGLDYDGIKRFIGLQEAEIESKTPIPPDKSENLGELLRWIYGSKKNDQDNLIKSQNPHLRQLDSVLHNRESIAALRRKEPLDIAFEITLPATGLFEQSLYDAKRAIQKAYTYVSTGYRGEVDLLKTVGTIVKGAQTLYETMDNKRSGDKEKLGPKYLTEED